MKIDKLTWIIAMFLLAATLVSAGQHNPETYWGYVYVEGALVPSGTILTLESASTGEVFASQTLPYNLTYPGSYSFMLIFDDSFTPEDEGAELNETLTWKINGIPSISPAPGADKAETGKTNNNFVIQGILNPAITATLRATSIDLSLGETSSLSIMLNNTGSGSGNAVLAEIGGNVTTDLPKTVYVARNGTNQTNISITANSCGQQQSYLAINHYNLAGTLVNTSNSSLSLNVTGADIILGTIVYSNSNPTTGDPVTITSVITNNGTANITGYSASFYYGITLIGTASYGNTLIAGESANVSILWNSAEGTHTIRVAAATSSAECNTANNEANGSITVSAPVIITPPGSGGGSGGGGGGGSGVGPSQNYTYDNLTENNETDIIAPDDTSPGKGGEIIYIGDEDEEEEIGEGGFIPIITGYATKIKEIRIGWLFLLLLLILIAIITYYMISKMKDKEQTKQTAKKTEKDQATKELEEKKEVMKDITKTFEKKKKSMVEGMIEQLKDKKKDMLESVMNRKLLQQKKSAGTAVLNKDKESKDTKKHVLLDINIKGDNKYHAKVRQEHKHIRPSLKEKPAKIQKSIKISSKKEIIDKLKEVYR